LVGTAYEMLSFAERLCRRLCPPQGTVQLVEAPFRIVGGSR
jgi:hypothetical protein